MQRLGSMKNSMYEAAGTFHPFSCPTFERYCCGSNSCSYAGTPAAFRTRAAQTLYSGIFEIGSCAAIVSWLALLGPAQWYGIKIVSGRIVVTTRARSVQL